MGLKTPPGSNASTGTDSLASKTAAGMPNPEGLENESYVSTFHAAQMLGVSVGTVQKMVEANVLHAWKTRGGHRRISQTSIDAHRKQLFSKTDAWSSAARESVRILFLDHDFDTLQTARAAAQGSGAAVTCLFLTTGMEAMMQMMAQPPDVIFSELDLTDLDGIELLRNLERTLATSQTHLVALTKLDDVTIAARGGIPPKAILIRKPLQPLWLEGFLAALQLESRL